MAIVVTCDVFCDGPDCPQWTNGVTGRGTRFWDARRNAKASGWVYVKHGDGWKDLCPDCQKELGIIAKAKDTDTGAQGGV